MYDLFEIAIGEYRILCNPQGLPQLLDEYRERATLVNSLMLDKLFQQTSFLAVARKTGWPFLVVELNVDPAAGDKPGVLLVEETDLLFVGACQHILAYDLKQPARLWNDHADGHFDSWIQYNDVVLMLAQLEFSAWDIRGNKLWTTYAVEPPWDFEVKSDTVHLDVMGKKTTFSLKQGPTV